MTINSWIAGIAAGGAAVFAVLTMLAAPAEAHGQAAHKSETRNQTAPATGRSVTLSQAPEVPGVPRLTVPAMNSAKGRRLFVSKGCVTCHSVNGVGGHDATALDAHTMERKMNPFEFAAKMWRMAPAMIYAQEEALGEQIQLTGQELADIIAFVHDDEEQHHFTEADVTPRMRKLMHHSHGPAPAHQEEIGHMHGAGEDHD